MENIKDENDRSMVGWGVLVTICIIGIWILTYFLLKDKCYEDRGTLGDMFGTVNALFSGLALAGIIFTILLQRRELRYQRDELRETRKEFIIQNKTLKSQRFENTFFNLLSLHNQIVNDIDYYDVISYNSSNRYADKIRETRLIKGKDVFRDLVRKLDSTLKGRGEIDFDKIYLSFYQQHKTDLGHYFRNLYRIIKMVDEAIFVDIYCHQLELVQIKNR